MKNETKRKRTQEARDRLPPVGLLNPVSESAAGRFVSFREIIDGKLWKRNNFQVPLLLGRDAAGNDLIADLAKLPHLLVAGAAGQGKSVCLNSIINGLLMSRTPEQVRFILIDPKRVEFTVYEKLPHLLVPVIYDTRQAVCALRGVEDEMTRRLRMFKEAGYLNIADFNARTRSARFRLPARFPRLVIVIDEFADLLREAEPIIAHLAERSRVTGIHMILSTRQTDARGITGTLRADIPARIAFKVTKGVESRTLLGPSGAEKLQGAGDMLFRTTEGALIHLQGAFISDPEIARIVAFLARQAGGSFAAASAAQLVTGMESAFVTPSTPGGKGAWRDKGHGEEVAGIANRYLLG